MKVIEVSNQPGMFVFHCPGCECDHHINTNPEYGGAWEFNRDLEKPTANPSLLVRWVKYETDENKKPIPETRKDVVCHILIREGKIQFLNDCTHDLANQTVDIPDYDKTPTLI